MQKYIQCRSEVAIMKAAFACLLLLAGSAYCTPVESKILPDWLEIPVYVPSWWPLEIEKPDWWPIIPPHPEWIPWPPSKPEGGIDWGAIEWPVKPEWLPEIDWDAIERPEWWPEIDWDAIEKPEWWPEIDWDAIEKPEWWPEIDWDAIERPEWWPEIDWEAIEKPQINKAVRGTPAAIEEFPGIVQIEIGYGPIWAQGCVGSVLTSLHVLSASRCFSGRNFNSRFRRIRAGSSRRYGGDVYDVDRVANHPSFGDTSENFFDGDIAVIRLRSFLVFGSNIQQSPIVISGFTLPDGVAVTHAGWGSTAQGDKISNRDLYKINLSAVDQATCSDTWSTLIPYETIKVTPNMICVGQTETGGRDTDFRDIGAPIFLDNVVVGIVSWGSYFGNQRLPVVATAVSSYTNWIVETAT